MIFFDREKQDQQRLIKLLHELSLDQYWRSHSAQIPFWESGGEHYIWIYLDGRHVHVWGRSRLVFSSGRVPPSVAPAAVRRNAVLTDIQWTTCNAFGQEYFGVSATSHIRHLKAAELMHQISETVKELERCRQILEFVKRRGTYND